MKSKFKKSLTGYVVVQSLVLLVFYAPWLSNSCSYFFRDLTHYIEPFARFTGESMAKMQTPLWNPWCYCGMPQMAISVQGIAYPATWLFSVLPFSPGLAATMVIHQLICGLGGFLLVYGFGWGILPAIICATTLAMSGYDFCFTSIFSLVESSAWCAISLWALQQLGRKRAEVVDGQAVDDDSSASNENPGDSAEIEQVSTIKEKLDFGWKEAAFTCATAVFVGMHILAGHPELGSVEVALLGAYVCWAAYNDFHQRKSVWVRVLGWRIRALALGAVLAMPAILPAFEWLGLSRRSAGLDPQEALTLSANWYDLFGLVLPQPLGDMQLRWSEFRPLVMSGALLPYMASAFVGPVVLTLALWSLADRKWKERWLVLGLTLIVLMMAMGGNAPLLPFILKVTRSSIRFPVKLMFFVVWGLAIMSARGLYSFIKGGSRGYLLSAVFWAAFAIVAFLLIQGAHVLDPMLQFNSMPESMQQLLRSAEPRLAQSALIASACGILFSAIGFLSEKQRKHCNLLAQIIVASSIGFLLYFACFFCRLPGPADYFQTPSLVDDYLKSLKSANPRTPNPRILGLYIEHFTIPAKLLSKNNLQSTINTYQYSRQVLRTNTNIDFAQPSSFGFEGTCTGEYYFFFHNCYGKSSQAFGTNLLQANDEPLARFCQSTATEYVITQVNRFGNKHIMQMVPLLDKRFFVLIYQNPEMNVRVFKVLNSLPRAYFTDSWEWIESHDDALTKIYSPESSKFNPLKKTVLEPNPGSPVGASPVLQARTSDSDAIVTQDTNETISIDVAAKRSGYLVLADQYYPGWSALVDGKQAEIVRANCFMKAVFVPEGKHTVRFLYHPVSFYAGLALCALAMVWMVCLFFGQQKRLHEDSSSQPPPAGS